MQFYRAKSWEGTTQILEPWNQTLQLGTFIQVGDMWRPFSLTGRQLLAASVLAHRQGYTASRILQGRGQREGQGLISRPWPTVEGTTGQNVWKQWGGAGENRPNRAAEQTCNMYKGAGDLNLNETLSLVTFDYMLVVLCSNSLSERCFLIALCTILCKTQSNIFSFFSPFFSCLFSC